MAHLKEVAPRDGGTKLIMTNLRFLKVVAWHMWFVWVWARGTRSRRLSTKKEECNLRITCREFVIKMLQIRWNWVKVAFWEGLNKRSQNKQIYLQIVGVYSRTIVVHENRSTNLKSKINGTLIARVSYCPARVMQQWTALILSTGSAVTCCPQEHAGALVLLLDHPKYNKSHVK